MGQTKRWFRRLTAIVLGGVLCTAMAMPAEAKLIRSLVGLRGDLNGDKKVDLTDITQVQQCLESSRRLPSHGAFLLADYDGNGLLDARDLTLMKRAVLNQTEPERVFEEIQNYDNLIEAPVETLHPTMPSQGNVRILLLEIDFSDCVRVGNFTPSQVYDLVFGPDDPNNPNEPAYPYNSITSYFDRASYGRLNLDGDVYQYRAKFGIDFYVGHESDLVDEAMEVLDSRIDCTRYDANEDGYIDTLIVALPGAASEEDWWPYSTDYTGGSSYDGVTPGYLCVGSWAHGDTGGFNSTWAHELCHAMGLPDYYRYSNYENTEEDDYGRGLRGDAGWELMDDSYSDLSAFSKLMLGWYTSDEIDVYNGGTKVYSLSSSQITPNCIIIPRGTMNNYHSEFFLIESVTPDKNNRYQYVSGSAEPCFAEGGVRILHCDAEIYKGLRGYELKWSNYSPNYNTSNDAQRVLRLVNPRGRFFQQGDMINGRLPEFSWYDDAGGRTLPLDVTITIDSLDTEGDCILTISDE